ncbi:flotillin family protein [Algicola sagamiensis]|uniref:hypothetical protein n=1 Tax=Algicola sagamiensis TaxID=163869 RepID=UPI00037277FF|nr:hypothetical protein [Algicola sagamiensis]
MTLSPSMIFVGIGVAVAVVLLLFLTSRYKKVRNEGEALIVNGVDRTRASLTGTFVWPVVNTAEHMDITRKKISVIRSGRKDQVGEEYEGLHCQDNIRADLKVDFYIGVNHEEEDIVRVAKLFTAYGASDPERLREHFQPKFSEALKTAVKQFDFEELLTNRRTFRDAVVKVIGSEMDGFKIYDVVIDKVDQTALDAHDPNNILDVEGIRKISEITSVKNTQTNAIRQDEETQIKKKNVEAEANRLQLDKQEKESIARTNREVEIIKAQEHALAEEKRQEYERVTQLAQLETEEEVAKKREGVEMEVELTRTANQRQIALQQAELERAVEAERVRTATLVEQKEMEKEASIEESKKAVAETRSQRVEIERKIAREEEETENLRANERVNRNKKVRLVEAEAEAEAQQIELIATSRAEKEAAKERAHKLLIENDTDIKIKNRDAENEIEVRTRIAEADLAAKTRQAEAEFIMKEKEAQATEVLAQAEKERIGAVGLAEIEVERERASVVKEMGEAEAENLKLKAEAEAEAIRSKGIADAEAQQARLEATKMHDTDTRDHDKWVMQLQQEKDLEMARIAAQQENAKALAQALSEADLKLFGGEGLEQLRHTMINTVGFDHRFKESEVLSPLVKDYMNGERSLPDDLKDILQNPALKSGVLNNMALASLMNSGNSKFMEVLQQALATRVDAPKDN